MAKKKTRSAELLAMLSRLGVSQASIAKKLKITPGHLTRLKSGERSSDSQLQAMEAMVDEEMRSVLREYLTFKKGATPMATDSDDWLAKANPALLEMSERDLVTLLGTVGDSQDPLDQKFKEEIVFIMKNRKPEK